MYLNYFYGVFKDNNKFLTRVINNQNFSLTFAINK